MTMDSSVFASRTFDFWTGATIVVLLMVLALLCALALVRGARLDGGSLDDEDEDELDDETPLSTPRARMAPTPHEQANAAYLRFLQDHDGWTGSAGPHTRSFSVPAKKGIQKRTH
jgi:hypothetical protein